MSEFENKKGFKKHIDKLFQLYYNVDIDKKKLYETRKTIPIKIDFKNFIRKLIKNTIENSYIHFVKYE